MPPFVGSFPPHPKPLPLIKCVLHAMDPFGGDHDIVDELVLHQEEA